VEKLTGGVAEARVERRPAAIRAADVAGYSRLMGVDEEGTLAALKAHRRELIYPIRGASRPHRQNNRRRRAC
jgi:class 3 adenylate cyclase